MMFFIQSVILATQVAAAEVPRPARADVHAGVGSCAAALATTRVDNPPAPIETVPIPDLAALVSLRAARGETLIVVRDGDFRGADLRRAHLHNICFYGTDFRGSDWRQVRADGLGFFGARLSGSKMAGARMPRILFDGTDLDHVDASGARFPHGRLEGPALQNLARLRLDGADLTGFIFDCGITQGDNCGHEQNISFRGADLTRASVDTYWGDADWTGARLNRTRVSLAQLPDLATADLAGPLIVRAGEQSIRVDRPDHAAILAHMLPLDGPREPSFDCTRSRSETEALICGPEGGTLRRLDAEVAVLYRRALATDPGVRAGQRAWLRERDRCGVECLYDSYEDRREVLINHLARKGLPDWARRDRSALLIAPAVEFDDAFQSTTLFRRLLPVIVASASSRIVVRVHPDGSVDADGDAIGGNGHYCGLEARRLRLDRRTGWLSGSYQRHGDEPEEWTQRPMPVLRLWGERAAVYRQGHSYASEEDPRFSDYVQCGARAGFADLVRVPVPAAQVPRLAAAWPWD